MKKTLTLLLVVAILLPCVLVGCNQCVSKYGSKQDSTIIYHSCGCIRFHSN